MTFVRTENGYKSQDGRVAIFDNGAGFGGQRGSGRWAVEIDGAWVANVDYLSDAKTLAAERVAAV